jgi:hypothetical protein
MAVIDQKLKDFTWQELFFHIEKATRKDPKGNKDITEKAEKYLTNTTLSFAANSTPLLKTDKHLKDQKKDLNNHKANKRDITHRQA